MTFSYCFKNKGRFYNTLIIATIATLMSLTSVAQEDTLRIFTWDGYVTKEDLAAVNKLLEEAKNPVRASVISAFAEGPEQMYNTIREGKADLSFLTLNYIKMQNEKTMKLLQPIDINSPRLTNYKNVLASLRSVPMGMQDSKPLYVPFGGGAYGLWANMKKIKKEELPKKIKDLLEPKWKGKISLTKGQVQPNVAMAMMALGHSPFVLDEMMNQNKRAEAAALSKTDNEVQKFLNELYAQVGSFWAAAPEFTDNLTIVASYGPEIAGLKAKGQDWQLVPFEEGNTVWLDTMNIMKSVSGKKLEAAEIFINYFLGKEVQNRVVNGLSMVAVTQDVKNPLIEQNANFFEVKRFWPPYHPIADNLMKNMSDAAMTQNKK